MTKPIVSIDLLDLDMTFRGMRSPRLGVSVASGDYRPLMAAQQAFRAAGGYPDHPADCALIVVAFAPGSMRNGEGKIAAREIFQHLSTDSFLNIGVIEDEKLPAGTIRVSVLLGCSPLPDCPGTVRPARGPGRAFPNNTRI